MSVWKDGKGRYHVAIQRAGKRVHRVCPPGATWRDAKRKEADITGDFYATEKDSVTIDHAIGFWLKTEVIHQRAQKETRGHAHALAEWVKGRDIREVVSIAESYKREHRGLVTNSTINRRLAVLRRVANLAYRRWDWLKEPLGQKIELLPENPAREVYLSRSELAALLRKIPQRDIRRAALVASFTGLRRSELGGLRPINVQGDLIILKNTKSGKPRHVPIVHHIRFALKRLPFGVHKDGLSHAVEKAANAAGNAGVRFHDLRHSCASFLIAKDVDLYQVGTILGHSSVATTKRYAHLAVGKLRDAMAKLGKSAPRLHSVVDEEKKEDAA